jgi:alpha-1,2-mannosyltransferase
MRTGETRDPWWQAARIQVWAACFVAGLLGVLVVQGFRMAYRVEGNDFTSYLLAARALWAGDNPYQVAMPFPYLYPLFLAFVLIPLTFVPYWLASTAWIFLSVAGLGASCAWLQQVASHECGTTLGRHLAFPALVVLLAFYLPVESNMIQGQVNLFVLFCCVMFFCFFAQNRPAWAGGWLAAAIAVKVLPAVLLVFLVVRGRYRTVLWTLLFTALFCAIPVIVAGTSVVAYYRSYWDAFVLPSMAGVRTNTPTHFSLQGSLAGILPTLPAIWLKIACGLGVMAGLLAVEVAAARSGRARKDIWPFCAYLVACLLLSPMVEMHHFVLAIPAVYLLGIKAFFDRPWTTRGVILCIVAFVACFDVVARVDPTMLCYFLSLAILLLLLVLAAATKGRGDYSPTML